MTDKSIEALLEIANAATPRAIPSRPFARKAKPASSPNETPPNARS